MTLPFTANEFLRLFRDYNQATWPAAILLPLAGLAAAWLLLSEHAVARRTALLIVAGLWAWTAIAYHLAFFASINPAARVFAVAALLQAAGFTYAGLKAPAPRSRRLDANRALGGALIAFALVVYPIVGYAVGHRYPELPTFGLPCPTTIFTIGVLATLHDELSWRYAVIPLLWAAVGTSAAFQLGMTEDLSLAASALLFIAVRVRGRRSGVTSGKPVRSFV
jgi:hypothetical protein